MRGVVMSKKKMLKEVSWDSFVANGMFWLINRSLHMLGYALVRELDDKGKTMRVYPAECRFRGFSDEVEARGFKSVTNYMKKNIVKLVRDANS